MLDKIVLRALATTGLFVLSSGALFGCGADVSGAHESEPAVDSPTDQPIENKSGDEKTGTAEEAVTDAYLAPNGTVTAPTWVGLGWTTVQLYNPPNPDPKKSASVRITVQAHGGYETLTAAPGTWATVRRQWGGFPITVTNLAGWPVRVHIY